MEQQWLLIENKGEIDINALVLMGGSTKRGDNSKVGYYGSGNKYSIALMLKKGIQFKIYSGLQELKITTEPVMFRDKQFEKILVNDKETSLTTDMGPQWDSWMGVREWVSNSIDEPESAIVNTTADINPKEGYTRIYIEHHADIQEVIENWDRYFSFDRIDTIVDNSNNRIYPNTDSQKESLLLYRRGIQCYNAPTQKGLYSYDLHKFSINESRVIDSSYAAKAAVCAFLCKDSTVEVARNILGNAFSDKGYWEGEMEWYYYGSNKLSEVWKEAIGDRAIIYRDVSGFFMDVMKKGKYYTVSKEMCKAIKLSFPEIEVWGIGQDGDEELIYRPVELNPRMKYMLKKAMEFFDECKYPVTHPIEIVEFEKTEILGLAKNKTILVAAKVFEQGLKEVVTTIMEEETHLTTGYKDETRELERYLFQMWCSKMEECHGIFL